MATIKKRFNFYKLEVITSDPEIDKERIIAQAFSNPPDNFHKTRGYRSDVMLYRGHLVKNGDYIMGALVNNLMDGIPPSFDEDTQDTDRLPLSENQGLGYDSTFLFDRQLNILVLEMGGTNFINAASFCKFFEKNLGLPKLEANFLIKPADYEDFIKMSVYKNLDIKIAKLEDGSIFKGETQSVKQIVQSADGSDTDTLEFKIAATKRKKSLDLSYVRRTVQGFLGYKETEEVTTLRVTGMTEDGSGKHTIDFIKERLYDYIELERPQRLISGFTMNEKHDKLVEMYNKHRSDIINSYMQKTYK